LPPPAGGAVCQGSPRQTRRSQSSTTTSATCTASRPGPSPPTTPPPPAAAAAVAMRQVRWQGVHASAPAKPAAPICRHGCSPKQRIIIVHSPAQCGFPLSVCAALVVPVRAAVVAFNCRPDSPGHVKLHSAQHSLSRNHAPVSSGRGRCNGVAVCVRAAWRCCTRLVLCSGPAGAGSSGPGGGPSKGGESCAWAGQRAGLQAAALWLRAG
jgi:hypothetical protein